MQCNLPAVRRLGSPHLPVLTCLIRLERVVLFGLGLGVKVRFGLGFGVGLGLGLGLVG